MTLQPGAQTQTVTVTSAVPQIDTTNAVLGGTVTNNLVSNLPINGRNFVKLLTVRPGSVVLFGGTNATTYNGMRGGDNLFLIDGIANFTENGEPIVNQSHGPGDSQSVLSMDAIQEFNVEVSPKAEYGWKDSAVIAVGIKSGTNDLHGTAFALGRDTSLDAGNFYSGLNHVAVENFGSTLGGRIVKDKLFYFVSFEGLRESVENSSVPTMPSDIGLTSSQDPNNQLSMVDACNAVGRAKVNPLSAELAGLPSGSCVPQPASSTFENVFPFNSSSSTAYNPHLTTPTTMNGGLFKVDYQANAKSHVNGTYYISRDTALSYAAAIVEPQWSTVNPTNIWLGSGLGSMLPIRAG